ncbi:MAG: tautomerase family protein [Holophagaceae bacterium]|nr:tautomerase family protein [Holophagaceae bacterium]
MPLVRIDVLEGRTTGELAALGDGVHRALVETIGIPAADRFQVLAAHPAGRLVFDPNYLDIVRTPGVVLVQITLSLGRSLEQKRALHAAVARILAADCGVRPEDVFINLVEVAKENWSFGNGIAQYAP